MLRLVRIKLLFHIIFRVTCFATGSLMIAFFSIFQGIKITTVGRNVIPAFQDKLFINARAVGKVNAKHFPQLAQEIAFPPTSVIVMTVLLKVD